MIKRVMGLGTALTVLVFCCIIEAPAGLSPAGLRAIGIMGFGLILWITESLPIVVTAMVVAALVPTLGVLSFSDAWASALNQAFFFTLGSYGVCTALLKLPLAKRVLRFIMTHVGNEPRSIIFGFVCLAAVISIFISDSGACILCLGFALSFMKDVGISHENNSRFGAALMLAIPAGAMAGGISTPISNSVNVLAIGLLESNVGISVDFFHWVLIGLPLAIIMVPVSAWALHAYFKPEPIADDNWSEFKESLNDLEPWTTNETKFVVILVAMIGFWIASSWVPSINIAVVALMGVALMMCPGIDLFKGYEYSSTIQVDPLILLPTTSILAAAVSRSGAGAWLVSVLFAGANVWPSIVVLIVIAMAACVAHIIVPIGPAVISITVATLFGVAVASGINPLVVTIILSVWGGATYTIPVDGLYAMTYAYGYYRTKDLAIYGLMPTVAWLVLCVTVVPIICGLL